MKRILYETIVIFRYTRTDTDFVNEFQTFIFIQYRKGCGCLKIEIKKRQGSIFT